MILYDIINHICDNLDTNSFLWEKIQGLKYLKFCIQNKYHYDLKNNSVLKDSKKNERCFILGNGPSLNQVDFSLLENEYVFTVNMLMDNKDFFKLKSNYHVIADAAIFNMDKNSTLERDYYLEKFHKLAAIKDLVLFAPLSSEENMKRCGLEKKINIRYFLSGSHYRNIKDIELTKVIPAFNKVIHYAILIAVYMGFQQIYLLGCEETAIMTCINLQLDGDTKEDHCYPDTEESKKLWTNQLKLMGIDWEFQQEALVFKNYKVLFDLCQEKGIEILNLTPKSLIDSIPKESLDNII